MKPLFSILFIFGFGSLSGYGQDIPYYENMLDSAQGTEKMVVLDSLLIRTFSTDPQDFIDYSLEYIAIAHELDSIEDAARKAMNLQRPLTNFANDPEKAVSVINRVLARKYKIQDSLLLGGLYLKRGRAMAKINLEKAIEDYTIALENFSDKDTLNIADAYLFRGQAYANRGNFVLASENYTNAYTLYEDKKEYPYMVFAQQGIVNMFSMNGFYDKAKTERNLLIDKMKSLQLDIYLAGEYYNQAIDYKKMGKRNLEYQYLLEAEKQYDQNPSGNALYIGIHSMLIAYYCDGGKLEAAKKHLDLLENLDYDFSADIPSQINYLRGKSKYLMAKGEVEDALDLAKRKLALAEQLGIEDEIMAAHVLLSKIYYASGEYRKSIESSRTAAVIKDSIYNKSTANALVYYQTLYEIEKKGKKLAEKNANIIILQKNNEIFKNVLVFGGIALMLSFGVVLLFRNQRHLKSKKLLHERFGQELLVSQEEERRRISKDMHDGVGQQLLVLKNKLILDGNEDSKNMVDNIIEEVRGISRDLYPFQLQEMGITKAIEYTIEQIDENTSLFISAEIDNIDNIFSKDNEVNIYRIVQESLSNILKHAKAGAGKVSIKKFTDHITISIKDNGEGFDFNEEYRDSKSLGLKTLMERTKFLKGQMKVTSKKESGTELEFEFPL